MGSVVSSASTAGRSTEDVTSESETMNDANENTLEEFHDTINEDDARTKAKEEEMNEFRKQLNIKREQRREILARHRAEKEELERSLKSEKASKLLLYESNEQLRALLDINNIAIPDNLQPSKERADLTDAVVEMREELDKLKSDNNKLRRDLVDANSSLQNAYSDIADLNFQNRESMKQISALKEVVTVSKTMINLREGQLNELKDKLNDIEQSLADRETNILSTDLRQEYERQLQNIRTLRGLYEERARLAEVTRQSLARELEEHKILYQAEMNKCKDLTVKLETLETKVNSLEEIISEKNIQIAACRDETNGLKAEMAVVNKLFSQVLLGYKTKQDLDILVHRLEENHGILTHMAEKENGSEASSALPKLLLELVSQVDNNNDNQTQSVLSEVAESTLKTETQKAVNTTPEEIVENLPKVWRVLSELLSHQNAADDNSSEKVTTCYKSVETKSGPVLVPSVSQTYIRLKDLIVEKLGLIKEVNNMKQLNSHLETRLQEQERRLCLVTTELSKTWHVVGRLRRHHHQLHTHEKILKYELQQKRKLLNELKEELEYCREKWEQARVKNTQSEKDYKKLRAEFTSRKTKASSPSFNNSGESGYSDERPSDDSSESNDESEYVAEPLSRSKKKLKKSFETILDSSTDFNSAVAEREDPVSDMLDVADLPLDTHESDDHHKLLSECSKSEKISKSENMCETEDEICDITHDDSCIDESTAEQQFNTCVSNEDLSNASEHIGNTSENISNVLTASSSDPVGDQTNDNNTDLISIGLQASTGTDNPQSINSGKEDLINETNTPENVLYNEHQNSSHKNTDTPRNSEPDSTLQTTMQQPDFKAILESIKQQNERLAKKDERLQNMENGCAEVVKNLSSTLNTGQEIENKLDVIHNGQNTNKTVDEQDTVNVTEPSTSCDMDHEARFAARDIRLKRLEEQTKSLVNKVNKTTSKGVKIHYKLEELHNIYGSENSRAGTPSEETEDQSNEEDLNN